MDFSGLQVDRDEVLLIDKPAGVSSFGVVARVRRELSEKAGMIEVKGKDGVIRQKRKKVKVGHTGTLDPFATGLLILLVGKGTKRANEFLKLDKEYIATIKLGEVSTTGDIEGIITPYIASSAKLNLSSTEGMLSESNPSARGRDSDPHPPESKLMVSDESSLADDAVSELVGSISYSHQNNIIIPSVSQVEEVVRKFIGEIEQTVPAYSAVKINGQRAYKLAREGKQVEMPRRKVKIYEIEILRYEWPELEIRCKVSSGTYIRALGEDIGKALGVGGYLTALRRTRVGKYRVEDAKKIGEPSS